MREKARVLCVGSAGFCNSMCSMLAAQQFQVLRAITLVEACRLFASTPDIDVIVLDEAIERPMDTMEFVLEVRRSSPVLMYVCCSIESVGCRFEAAGCHNYLLTRQEIVEALADIASSICC